MVDEEYIFRFTPTGDGPPTPVRIRRLLKCALRRFGLRAAWAPVAIGKPVVAEKSDAGKPPTRGKAVGDG